MMHEEQGWRIASETPKQLRLAGRWLTQEAPRCAWQECSV